MQSHINNGFRMKRGHGVEGIEQSSEPVTGSRGFSSSLARTCTNLEFILKLKPDKSSISSNFC